MASKYAKVDRRVRRTRRSLSKALIELIQEKHYDSITVQDIIDRADVGRSTFYTHFRDKEDLFRGDWEKFLGLFVDRFKWENLKEERLVPIEHLLEHLKEFHPFYRGLVRSGKEDSIFRYGQKHLAMLIEEKLNSMPLDKRFASVPLPIISNYLSTEIFSILRWWLDHNMPHQPEKMEEIFNTLVMPGIRATTYLEKTQKETKSKLRVLTKT